MRMKKKRMVAMMPAITGDTTQDRKIGTTPARRDVQARGICW